MHFGNMPIRRKLIAVNLLTSGVVLLLTCASFLTYEFITLRKNMVLSGATRAQIIAANSSAALAFESQSDAASILAALATDRRIMTACIYDRAGNVFVKFPTNAPTGDFPASPGPSGYRRGSLEIFCPVVQGDRTLGTVFIRSNLSALTDRYRAYAWLASLISAGSILVAYLLSRALQKQISVPILALAETAHVISNHRDFSVRASKSGDDELGLLTDAFNEMLGQIQSQDQAIKKLNTGLEHRVALRTAELEAANKELEAFSYSVSHDLRAPLRAVDGFSQAVQEDYGALLPEEGRRQLQTIRDGAQRMGVLIDDLLAFARLSRAPVNLQTVDTDKLVREVLDELISHQPERRIEIKMGELPPCQGDAALLKQVWINLLSNAVKYTRQRDPAVIEISCTAEKGGNIYLVRDNGAGFDMKYAKKLFGVFQRLHRTDEFEGTGVGLAIVQRVIHRHGGQIWTEAAVDRGATFYFNLGEETKL